MFLLIDIHPFQKQLDHTQPMTCPQCGRFGRYEVYVTGSRFRLFFIPLFTFGKQYVVRTTCCDKWFKLDPEKGKAIEKNQPVPIDAADLEWESSNHSVSPRCPRCGQPYEEGVNYCSNCGEPLR